MRSLLSQGQTSVSVRICQHPHPPCQFIALKHETAFRGAVCFGGRGVLLAMCFGGTVYAGDHAVSPQRKIFIIYYLFNILYSLNLLRATTGRPYDEAVSNRRNGLDRSVKLQVFRADENPSVFCFAKSTSPEWEANRPCRGD